MNEPSSILQELQSHSTLVERTTDYIKRLEAELEAAYANLHKATEQINAMLYPMQSVAESLGKSVGTDVTSDKPPSSLADTTGPAEELLKAAANVLNWIEAKHRPPVNDCCGGMALVRLHALADLAKAVEKYQPKPKTD